MFTEDGVDSNQVSKGPARALAALRLEFPHHQKPETHIRDLLVDLMLLAHQHEMNWDEIEAYGKRHFEYERK